MMPKENFLMKTVPYLLADEKAAFVQTPQHFYRKDIFQRGLPKKDLPHNEQDYFYLELEIARNRCNAVIFGGSNTLLSRRALDEAAYSPDASPSTSGRRRLASARR